VQIVVRDGVAPAQIGFEDLAGKVVRVEPLQTLFDEGQLAQPREELGGSRGAEHVRQQRLGRDARVGAHRQRSPVHLARDALDESLQQRSNDVRRALRTERGRGRVAGEQVGQQ
jgi:hypothetical protein